MKSKFHSGEIAVQKQAGVQDMAKQVAKVIRLTLPPNLQNFLYNQRIIIMGSIDESNRVRASILTGEPGFIQALDEQTIRIDAVPVHGDPLLKNLPERNDAGILAIELSPRRCLKVKGKAEIRNGNIYVRTERVYAQCPKYMQAREVTSKPTEYRGEKTIRHSGNLTKNLQKWIAKTDTLFIASYHEESGVDVSHRGGKPGFIRVLNQNKIVFPDYSGNSMFNTLGNITVNPVTGLLFIDFDQGSTLQIAGRARIIWDENRVADFAGAERLVEFQIEQVIHTDCAIPIQ